MILGSALDIVTYCGVPRLVFTDFPLGNPCGRPYDADMQRDIIERGLRLVETATGPRAIAQTPHEWSEDQGWRDRYMEVRDEDRPTLLKLGAERRALKARLKAEGRVRKDG